MDTGLGVFGHIQALALVFHIAAAPADLFQAALNDKQIFFPGPDQDTGKLPVIVKGQLIQLLVIGL